MPKLSHNFESKYCTISNAEMFTKVPTILPFCTSSRVHLPKFECSFALCDLHKQPRRDLHGAKHIRTASVRFDAAVSVRGIRRIIGGLVYNWVYADLFLGVSISTERARARES